MILLCGIASEPPLALVREELDRLKEPYVIFNQRLYRKMSMDFEIYKGEISGYLKILDNKYDLEDFCGVYIRLMDDQMLPELFGEHSTSLERAYCRSLHEALIRWCEVSPARIVNRLGSMGTNFSKPYQLQLIRENGFEVPDTLITNDPDMVRDFLSQHEKVIYKSVSAIRSIVQTFQAEDLKRLNKIRWCPVQFQEYIEGNDFRVHTINGEVFATQISSKATDYRYSMQQVGDTAELRSVELDNDLAKACLRLSESLGLAFAGIDLRITPDNRVYCLEVNPSPGYSYYQANTNQPISMALANYLMGSA